MTNDTQEKDNTPQIFRVISAVMADVSPVRKDKRNKQQGFNYRGIDDIYNELHESMAKHQLFTVPEVIEETRTEKPSKSGGVLFYTRLKMKYHFFASDGSTIATIVIGEAMDSGDKASNKAMAIAHKYALLQIFMIPTEDLADPDASSPEVTSWITPEQVANLAALIEELGVNERAFLGHIKAQSLERIQSAAYDDCVRALERKRK